MNVETYRVLELQSLLDGYRDEGIDIEVCHLEMDGNWYTELSIADNNIRDVMEISDVVESLMQHRADTGYGFGNRDITAFDFWEGLV